MLGNTLEKSRWAPTFLLYSLFVYNSWLSSVAMRNVQQYGYHFDNLYSAYRSRGHKSKLLSLIVRSKKLPIAFGNNSHQFCIGANQKKNCLMKGQMALFFARLYIKFQCSCAFLPEIVALPFYSNRNTFKLVSCGKFRSTDWVILFLQLLRKGVSRSPISQRFNLSSARGEPNEKKCTFLEHQSRWPLFHRLNYAALFHLFPSDI